MLAFALEISQAANSSHVANSAKQPLKNPRKSPIPLYSIFIKISLSFSHFILLIQSKEWLRC